MMQFFSKKVIYGGLAALCVVAAFAGGIVIGQKTAYHVDQPGTIDFSLFWDAYGKLKDNFVAPEKINDQQVIYGAIAGMARSTGDPYTTFFDPQEAKTFQQDLSGSFGGIGAEIGIRKNALTIIAPLEGTPAKAAGLASGDIIVKIDGTDTTDMPVDKAVSLIRGQKGTKVTLNVYRESWSQPKDITITRSTISPDVAKWQMKDGDTAYIQVFQFDRNLPEVFSQIASQVLQSGAKRIVLDLRNNPGGYLDVAQTIAGWFLKPGDVVTTEDYGGARPQDVYSAQGAAQLAKYPTVVLINGGSASASEILAGALRDNRKVTLIGQKSFGKGSVQTIFDLPGGSLLKVTIAKWLTPDGHSIAEVGLTPDVAVELSPEDIDAQKDPQLEKALEIVKQVQ